MPMAEIKGQHWTFNRWKDEKSVIVWHDPNKDNRGSFNKDLKRCSVGYSCQLATGDVVMILDGSEAVLGYQAIACLKCYARLPNLKKILKPWNRDKIVVLHGSSF